MMGALAGRVLGRVLVVPAQQRRRTAAFHSSASVPALAEDRAVRVFGPSSTVVAEAQGATVLRPEGGSWGSRTRVEFRGAVINTN